MDFSVFLSNLQQPFTESIVENTLLTILITVFCLFDCIFGFVEFLGHAGPIKPVLKAIVLTVVTIALCIFVKLVFAVLIIVIVVFFMILYSARKRGTESDKEARKRPMEDSEPIHLPPNSGLTTSLEYKLAVECIIKEHPREALEYLGQCRGKIAGKPRFFISYADALMQLDNFSGALAKLNAIPAKRLKKKSTFINVTVRKTRCYHGLHEYEKELECYDSLLAKNIQPEIYYFDRGKVKLRMLEVAPCLKSVEQAIADVSSSQQDFIKGIFSDLDKARRYSKQDEHYEGKILSYEGACCIHTKAYQEGWEFLMEARKKNEFYPNTYVYLGIYQYDKKDPFQAICELRKAISNGKEIGAVSDVACYYLAKIYCEMGAYDSAIRLAAQSLSIFSCRSECFIIQGECYKEKMMYTEAIECYTKAIELMPKAQYYASRAYCYYCRNNRDSEKSYYDMREAIKLADNSNYQLSALLYRANMDKKKNIHKDKTELNELLAPFQGNPENFVNLGIIYNDYQYFEESQQYYRKAIEKNPENGAAHFDLALVLWKLELHGEAIEELNIAIELEPMNVNYYTFLADCYRYIDDRDNEALTRGCLEKVYQAHCEIHKKSGDAVYQLNKYQMAVSYYQAALTYCSSHVAVLNNLACAYYALELYEEAIQNLEKAIKLNKQYFLAYFNLGNCQLRMSKNGVDQDLEKKAKENFEITVSLNAESERASLMLKSMDAESIEMLIDTTKL